MTDAKANAVRVLYCHCAYADVVPRSTADAVREAIGRRGDAVIVEDLCGLCARRDPRLRAWTAGGEVTVVACYPRAVRWLLSAGGVAVDADALRLTVLNMRTDAADTIVARLPPCRADGTAEVTGASPGWVPWFPVIDGDRCVQCGQCRDFCLFGVYATAADRAVDVARPENCKNNCPACARICPRAAIVFPKLDEGPINGDEIRDEAAQRERIKVDVDKILGSDIYATLAARQDKARRRRIDRQRVQRALAAREACRDKPHDAASDR